MAAIAAVMWGQTAPPRPAAPHKTAPAASRLPSYKELVFPPLHAIQTANVERSQLANGMKLYLVEDHELPAVTGSARVRTGSAFDPPDRAGLAHLTSVLLRTGGTRLRTGDQLDRTLEGMNARVEAVTAETTTSVSFSTLAENAGEVLRMVEEMLSAPAFRMEKLVLAKAQFRGAIARRNEDGGAAARRELAAAVYGKETPYGRQEEDATIARIQRSDVEGFYRRYFFPANVTLAVRGDFDAVQMKAGIEKLFAGWTEQQPAVPEFPQVTPAPAGEVYVAAGQNPGRTSFALGQLGGELRDKDSAAWEVLMEVLGGRSHSRLAVRWRSFGTGAGEIGAQWQPGYDHPGLIEIAGSANPVGFSATLQAIREEVDRMRTSGVTDEELKFGREAALERLALAGAAKGQWLARQVTGEYYGYPADFVPRYQQEIAAVTRADVERLAQERLQAVGFTVVAVGNAEVLRRELEPLGRPVTALDWSAVPAKIEPPVIDPSTVAKAKELLARAQQASGGVDRLAAVKDLSQTTSTELAPPSGSGRHALATRWIPPTQLRQEESGPRGRILVYTDGKSGWVSNGRGSAALTGAPYEQVQGQLFRLYLRLLLADRIEGRSASAADDQTVEIREGARVAWLVFDPATGLPSKILHEASAASGLPVVVEEDFEDFREVAGIKMPFRIQVLENGQPATVRTVSDLKINQGLKVEDLVRRP